jgi:hypothetical protein
MDTRQTMLDLIDIGFQRVREGYDADLFRLLHCITGRESLADCTDEELFSLVLVVESYDVFYEAKAGMPLGGKVVQLEAVSLDRLLGLTEQETQLALWHVRNRTPERGLAYALESGVLGAWLRVLRVWSAGQDYMRQRQEMTSGGRRRKS